MSKVIGVPKRLLALIVSILIGIIAKLSLAVLLLLVVGTQLLAQVENGSVTSTLEVPSHRAVINDSFKTRPAALPHWERQYFVSALHEITSPQPNVALFDQNGNLVRAAKIWFPDSVRVDIYDAAVTPQGNIVASGYAARSDGSIAHFIAKIDPSGAVSQVVRTNPFKASKVCALDENTVWSFGEELNKEDAGQDYRMLRNYSFTDGLLHAYVPRRSFKPLSAPIVVGSAPYWLRCSGEKVAVYSGWQREYLQLNVARNTLDRFPVEQMPGNMMVTGFAVTGSGHVYASLNVTGDGTLGLKGLFELKYDALSKLAHWVPVQPTLTHFGSWQEVQAGKFLTLSGTDGVNLIYEQTGQSGFTWARPRVGPLVTAASAK